MQLLELGNRHRTTRSTDYNITSSRSHAILQLTFEIERTDAGQTVISHSKLSLVDLAGSEKMLTTTMIDTDKHVRHILSVHTYMHDILCASYQYLIVTPLLCPPYLHNLFIQPLSIHPHTTFPLYPPTLPTHLLSHPHPLSTATLTSTLTPTLTPPSLPSLSRRFVN